MGSCWHVGVSVAVLGPEIAIGWMLLSRDSARQNSLKTSCWLDPVTCGRRLAGVYLGAAGLIDQRQYRRPCPAGSVPGPADRPVSGSYAAVAAAPQVPPRCLPDRGPKPGILGHRARAPGHPGGPSWPRSHRRAQWRVPVDGYHFVLFVELGEFVAESLEDGPVLA